MNFKNVIDEYIEKAKNTFVDENEIIQRSKEHAEKNKDILDTVLELKEIITDADWKTKVLIFAGLLYLLNPADVVPDVIAITGFLDDIAVLMYILGQVKKEHRNNVLRDKNE